jgi:hypothetical protein
MYYDPTGIIRELFYLEDKYRDLPGGLSFHAVHAEWFLDFALMAERLGNTSMAAKLLRRGVREAGPVRLTREILKRVAPAVRRRLNKQVEVPFGFDESVEDWLRRYADYAPREDAES